MSAPKLAVALATLLASIAPLLAQEAGKPDAGKASQPQKPWTGNLTAPAKPTGGGDAGQLPNGASAINETYGDWTATCTVDKGAKLCAVSQQQGNQATGQRSFAIELRQPKDGKQEGTILMPFGLDLDAGAVLKLDDKDLGKGLRFSTCIPQGCMLPVSFPTVATDAMRKAQKLTVASLDLASGKASVFTVSLDGYGTALDRIGALAK